MHAPRKQQGVNFRAARLPRGQVVSSQSVEVSEQNISESG